MTSILTTPIECEYCHAVFVGEDNAQQFADHLAVRHTPTQCQVCQREFREGPLGKADLVRHLKGHERKGEWPLVTETAMTAESPLIPMPDETSIRPLSLPDDIVALEARLAYVEEQLEALYSMFNIHQRRADSHQNPQPTLGVH